MTLLIVFSLLMPTQRPTFPRVDRDEARPFLAPPAPSPVSPDAAPIEPAPLPRVTDPDPSTQPSAGPTTRPGTFAPTGEPEAISADAPSESVDSEAVDLVTAGSPSPEPESAERPCDPEEPYIFRDAASGREVVLARCVSVDGAPGRVDAPPLSNALVLLIQTRLDALGFDPGAADGLIGPRTRDAIRRFQTDQGVAPTGAITFDLLDRLRESD
jgi:hypothetical protein